MSKIITILTISLSLAYSAYGQIDNEFWFAAPDVTSGHYCNPALGDGRPVSIYVTAEQATIVKIEMPGNPFFTTTEFYLSAGEHRKVQITPTYTPDVFENVPISYPPGVGQTIHKKVFHITSNPGNITAYYELDNGCNRDIFALKGKNALGTDFYVSTQNYFNNGSYSPPPYSGFVIAATEDGTTITIHRNGSWFNFSGAPAVETIVLNKGESFPFVASSQAAAQHIMGVHVTSDKKIAITWYDDSMAKSTCRDIAGDQLIPTTLIGRNYIVMKGDVQASNGGEQIFITATQNATTIKVDGVVQTTINAGQTWNKQVNNLYEYIECTEPVYINHISGTGGGCELAGSTLPTIDGCTGSHSVTFTRGMNTTDPLRLNLMVRNETSSTSPYKNKSIDNFTLKVGNNSFHIPKTFFIFLPDSSWAVLDNSNPAVNTFFTQSGRITPGTTATIENPISRFHLGVQNGGPGNGGKYGYFSDYASNRGRAGIGGPKAPSLKTYCNMDPIMFAVEGGIAYKWFSLAPNAGDTIYLNSTTNSEVYLTPPVPRLYKFGVTIYRECYADTIIYLQARVINGPVADFTVSSNVGCSPFSPLFTNTTDFALADKMLWNFNAVDYSDTISQTFLTNPFNHTFPENLSDSLQVYRVRLTAWGPYGSCPTEREMVITVKPGVKSQFTVDDSIGCSPLTVNFNNQSTGHINSTGYYWDFGDQTQSFDSLPSKTYQNYGFDDTTYVAKLVVTSTFGCNDTAFQDIVVHPYIKASLALDTALVCSPMQLQLKVNNSIGVDTFKWHIDYSDRIAEPKTLNYSPLLINHSDTSLSSPDTVKIDLVVLNRMGCSDTFPQRQVIVMPEVKADFDIDQSAICDSVRVNFSNASSGYKLEYNVDFGDGVSAVDTIKRNYTHRYFNRTTSDVVYNAKLTVTSDKLCIDSKDTVILVHPYVKANFALDYLNNCAPININVTNLSTNVDNYLWNWGDGTAPSTSGAPFLTHQYWNPLPERDTTYYLKLKVTSAEGCSDSTQREILIFPQVVAAFDIDKSEGCNPLTIAFQNNSTGKDLGYNWHFGPDVSGSESANLFQRSFNHYSPNDSTFNVTLTAFNSYGCDSSVSRPVTVYAYIDADFLVAKSDSCSPFAVRITNRSPEGAKFYDWDFGDGTPVSTDFEPDHTYHNTSLVSRTDNLRLVVKNNHACYDTMIKPITVYPEIDAGFTIDKTEGCQPLTVNFLNNNTNIIPGTEFYWTFGDGTFSTRTNPLPHVYSNSQDVSLGHTIKLNAMSQYGCSDSASQNILIYPFIFAKFAVDKASVCSDEQFEIDRSASYGGISQYLWDFNNDGITDATSSSPVFNHAISNTTLSPQNNTVKLTVTNLQGCDTSWTQQIVINPEITAAFEIDNTGPCYPTNTVLHNTSSFKGIVATKFLWDFGDGSVSTNADDYITYRFHNFDNFIDKEYTINLIAESDYKCTDTISHTITIHPKPKADFNFPVTVDCPPFPVTFTNISRGTDLTYQWDFADGGFSADKDPTHIFSNDGFVIKENNIELISTTQFGCSDTVYKPILVYPKVDVDFDATAWHGCSPMVITFDGSAVNQNYVIWYLNEDAFSTLENPTYRFVNNTPDNQTYDIRFKATSLYNCTADTVKQITIYPSPATEFIPDPVLQDFNTETDITTVQFKNYTQHQDNGQWEYRWDFGDGTTGSNTEEVFNKEYTIWGDINNKNKIPVSLLTWNRNNPECRDSAQHEIIINPPLPQIDIAEDVAGCEPLTVNFMSTTKYIYEDSYSWDFGYNGQTGTGAAPMFTYNEPGVYIVKLTVEGDGGLNWDYKKIIVHSKPQIDFTFAPGLVMEGSETEEPTPVKFFNSTMLGNDYTWEFGDGQSSIEKEPTHVYEDTGKYYVTLVATSIDGCMDTMLSEIPVIVEGARKMEFPNAFVVDPAGPADEYYDPSDPNRAVFRPVAQGVENYRLEIYNRWGELIYVSEDINKGWNGYVDGKIMKQDVYIWRVTATFTDGKPFMKAGDITLLVKPATNQ
ncbi:MAG: PKD domain-containing protein [Bacteroidales bacterium]|nr:PKD domain-containing protein [Bacteroidales bacterium]